MSDFTATDPEGDEISFHLVSGEGDGNNSLFLLDQNGTLKTAAILDYETVNNLSIRVQAKDDYNATTESRFWVSVINVIEDLDGDEIEDHLDDDIDGDGFSNEEEAIYGSDPRDPNSVPNYPPRDLKSTRPLLVYENQPVGTVVGEFNAIDPEGGSLSYSLLRDDENNSLFSLDNNGTLRTAVVFDYETNATTYTIHVQVRMIIIHLQRVLFL